MSAVAVPTSCSPSAAEALADRRFMRDALALGRRHLGLAWPNPSVGAVLVRQGPGGPVVVGRGITQPGGRPHAEVVALAAAGSAAAGATLYVTLEPCAHIGRSPPCAEAVVQARIARVVSALKDPNPLVAGHGYARIAGSGIALTTDVLRDEAMRDHRGHVLRIREARPAVTVKLARTADGFAASASGPRLMITGPAANARVHLLRAHADAILVGVGTVLADDPQLTVRLPGLVERSPVRIVFDSHLATPPGSRLVMAAAEVPTWIVAAETAPVSREDALVRAGAEVMRVAAAPNGRIDLGEALRLLCARGITRVFCEGGPTLAEALAAEDLVDEAVFVTGSATVGTGLPAVGAVLAARIAGMREWDRETAGDDRFSFYERPM